MPDIYEVQAPDGSTLEVQSDGPPTPEVALRAIRAYGDQQAAGAQKKAEAGSTIGSALRPLARGALDALPGIGAVVGGVLSTPSTGGIGTIPGIALGAGAGRGVRDLIAAGTGMEKPSTAVGEGAKIAGETAMTGATAAVLPGLVTAVKSPIQTLREGAETFGSAMPRSIQRLGRLFPSMPKSTPPILERPPWQTGAADIAAPPSVPAAVPASASAPPVTAPALSAVDRAALVKQRYSTETLAKIEAQMQPMGPVQPVAGPTPQSAKVSKFAQDTAGGDQLDALQQAMHGPDPASVPNGGAPSPLQGPRVQVGAEQVGRGTGQTTQQVRQQTGPILNEDAGEASPVFPQGPFDRMHDKLLAMGHGNPARLDYVKAAADPKTAGLLETMRRTLERNGLAIGGGTMAEAMRRAVLAKLHGDGGQEQ